MWRSVDQAAECHIDTIKAQFHSATGELLADLYARLEGGDFLLGAKYTVSDIARSVTSVMLRRRIGNQWRQGQ